ncbi:type II toxin-antitoxin system YafO family toxin [Vibrio vulnificus]|uniref:type II toxin-antitoxin system YafO family toxin n=1 Tax=Vibrio vulnificus TaxID=672 RepID=UPI000CD00060|nr:hypothetical protein [Vibrio vulnificus]EIX4890276.1 type II toxin-antitoxin system YafO family toxin [Vibrio vulnificus]EIZ1412027.1 type II toxin-antitoxin system YafO family toxin [Vibrio vulnificus]EJA3296768.1 type II toxin-antitoxin system YafO family toxin [Vibrio vulnificus]EKL0034365.1 type II toxin-antitoxin system YafO family toxin [Vibrio vulnificus]
MFVFKVSKEIRSLDESQKIIDGFKDHKNGNTPSFLGRDVGFDHPDTPPLINEYLDHIHLCLPTDAHPRCWLVTRDVYRRVNKRSFPARDFALIYWFQAETSTYYLFDIIGPDAHNYDEWLGYLKSIASRAEKIDLGR